MKKVILEKDKKYMKTIKITCPSCDGSGTWVDEDDPYDDKVYTCSKCRGKGKIKVKVFKKIMQYYCIKEDK